MHGSPFNLNLYKLCPVIMQFSVARPRIFAANTSWVWTANGDSKMSADVAGVWLAAARVLIWK
jgi:hypothetical protein